jgi:phosphate transport system ATP-binding protein
MPMATVALSTRAKADGRKRERTPAIPAASVNAAFELHGLDIAYGSAQVLCNVACNIPEGAVTAIMGPSGCGKSTLVKTLNRTLELIAGARVAAGTVSFRGQDLYAPSIDPRAVRKAVGIIHQLPVPFPMSILENVLFGASFHGQINGEDRTEYARHYLDRVGLWDEVKDRLGDRAERLSGGQQQRLCPARTLATKPKALLLDEPCSALDPVATRHIEEHVRDLKRDFPVVIVTHNVAQARRVSDYVLFLYEGKLIEAGLSEQIFAAPKSDLARAFTNPSSAN